MLNTFNTITNIRKLNKFTKKFTILQQIVNFSTKKSLFKTILNKLINIYYDSKNEVMCKSNFEVKKNENY